MGRRHGKAMTSPGMLVGVALAVAAVGASGILFHVRGVSGHSASSYAYIEENSVGAYTGVIGRVDFSNPNLGSGSFTNGTLWAVDDQECGGSAWIEVGWSKRADWGGQARHKFMWRLASSCVLGIWPDNLGLPLVGRLYEYRLVYSATNRRWEYFVDGQIKAAIRANWTAADRLFVGDELSPPYDGTVYMGPTHFQMLRYRLTNNAEAAFYYHDFKHCDVTPPLNPYNFIYPASVPDWIYVWGPAAGGYCGAGGP